MTLRELPSTNKAELNDVVVPETRFKMIVHWLS